MSMLYFARPLAVIISCKLTPSRAPTVRDSRGVHSFFPQMNLPHLLVPGVR